MKKDCTYTRRRLSRYLAGHLFLLQRRRIERHLASCALCRSEFDAVRRIDETQRILRDIGPAEGLARPLNAVAASLRRLLFRPLWLAVFVAAAIAAYVYVIHPLLHDPDLDRLDAPVPPAAAPAAPPHRPPVAVTPEPEPKKTAPPGPAAAPAASPLVITITMEKEKEKSGIQQINEAMKEHPQLRTMRFSESVREISGSLTAVDLYTFFSRIEGAGKVTYKRSRLAAAGEGELVSFVMKLQTISAHRRPAGAGSEQPRDKTVTKSAETPAETQPAQADVGSSQTTSQGQ